MPALTIELPSQAAQTEFNLRRWDEVLADPNLAKLDYRVETDRHGYAIMSPPPAARHGAFQAEIGHLLRTLMAEGRALTECPISTADGVRAADVAWASPVRIAELGNRSCFPQAPEICVEILSPGNTTAEIQEKIALYFDAGAREVWICDTLGNVTFFGPDHARLKASGWCADFPREIQLP